MRNLGVFVFLLITAPLTAAAADANLYWGLMAGESKIKIVGEEFNPTSLTGRLGFELNKFLSVEARGMFGQYDGSSLSDTLLEITYLGNASVKLNIPFGDVRRINVYGLAGYSTWKLTAKQGTLKAHDTYDGASYGVGIDLIADGINGLNIEYIRYGDINENGLEYTLDTASIGYFRRF